MFLEHNRSKVVFFNVVFNILVLIEETELFKRGSPSLEVLKTRLDAFLCDLI